MKIFKFDTHFFCIAVVALYVAVPLKTVAQNKPHGYFVQRNTTLGQPISYSLSYRHDPTAEVIFPDSSYNFAPFELKKKQLFTTKTNQHGSLDSVVYTLVSFDIQPLKKLALPIQIMNGNDTTFIFSEIDSVFFKENISDSLLQEATLKNDTFLLPAEKEIDTWRYTKVILSVLLGLGVLFLLFGKIIFRTYKLFVFTRKHRDFTSKFKRYIRESTNENASLHKALLLWKNHLQWLENKPFNSFTTKEILDNIPNERLGEALREIDMAIYGGVYSTQMPFAMNKLMDIANELYKIQLTEYAHKLRQQ